MRLVRKREWDGQLEQIAQLEEGKRTLALELSAVTGERNRLLEKVATVNALLADSEGMRTNYQGLQARVRELEADVRLTGTFPQRVHAIKAQLKQLYEDAYHAGEHGLANAVKRARREDLSAAVERG